MFYVLVPHFITPNLSGYVNSLMATYAECFSILSFTFNVHHHYRLNARQGIRDIRRDETITLETFQFHTVDRSDATGSTP